MDATLKVESWVLGELHIAQFIHFSNICGSEVVAVFDPHGSGINRAKSMAPAVLVTDHLEKFMAAGVNTIAVCWPDKTHADYVVAALEAGKHVVCEKPLTDSLDGCRRILNAEAKAKGVVAAVQHQMQFFPIHAGIKRIIKIVENLEELSYIRGYYVPTILLVGRLYMTIGALGDNTTPLVYSGCHFVDLLRWLLGEEVEEVIGMANNIAFPEYPESDMNVLLFRFKSGVIGKVVVAFGAGKFTRSYGCKLRQ